MSILQESPEPDLQRDAAVERRDGGYAATISPEWVVWSPQGGYLMAMAVRAAGVATEFPKPFSLGCHFLSVPKIGPIDLQIVSLRKTRIAESLRVSMVQDGRVFLEAMVWTGTTLDGYVHADAHMPEVPGYEGLASNPAPVVTGPMHTLWKNIEQRPCQPLSWERTAPAEPRQRDWVRLRRFAKTGNPFIEASRYALVLDTFTWPAAAHAHVGDSRFIAPTLSFAIDFHEQTDSEWLLSDAYAPVAGDGRIAMHQKVWSPDGKLIASGSCTTVCRARSA